MPTYLPKLISRVEGTQTKQLVTSEYWNEIFNLLIEQGNYNTSALKEVLQDGSWSLGHVIKNEEDVSFGRTKYLKFVNFNVEAADDTTIITGVPGPVGPIGPQGNPTPALHILGLYATLSALQSAHPIGTVGDAYAVGTTASNVIYVWDVANSAWVNLGVLSGAVGAAGPGVPSGGTSGQILTKIDGTSYNTTWTSLPSTLQYLTGLDTNVKSKFAAIDTALGNVQESIVLTAGRVVISDAEGKLASSSVTTTKLNYLSGLTSDPQTQLNSKLGVTAKAADSTKIDGRTIFVGSTPPAGGINGDIWFKV